MKSPFGPGAVAKTAWLVVGAALLVSGIVSAQMPHPGGSRGIGPTNNGIADKDYVEGLDVWRKPDHNDLACAFCHSPDGIEIASYNFDDADIHRRAVPHLGNDGANKIVSFIHAVRKKYHITKLLDPMENRPLQPGGQVLPGKTPAERDLAFARELQNSLPTLAAGDVNNLVDAEKAKEELLAINPRNLRVGIPFNRLSEDGFHGMEHATFANWIADTALRFHFSWLSYFVLQDAYLRDPSDANLLLMVQFPKLHQSKEFARFAQLMTNDKFRSLLIYQHILRKGFEGETALDQTGPVLLGNLKQMIVPNPLLDLGLFADERYDTPFAQFQFPDDTLSKKEHGITEAEQIRQIRLPSLYAGWLMDQGLKRSENCEEQVGARIITERLLSDGPYPMLDAFMITKKMVTDGYAPEAWNGRGPQHFSIDYSAFLGDDNFEKFQPKNPQARAMYRRFVRNSFKMSLLLYKDQEQRGVTDSESATSKEQASKLNAYLNRAQ
jgi:hypothetical protein